MAGPVAAVVFVVIAAVLFTILYLALPFAFHFFALIAIGSVAIVFGLAAYFLQALSADASVQRALSWGFGAMGFATLFLAILLPPTDSLLTLLPKLTAVLFLLILLAAWGGGIAWRSRVRGGMAARAAHRADWDSRAPPSALSYHPSSAPAATAPPTAPPSGSPPPGAT